jgi:hypothetical protein
VIGIDTAFTAANSRCVGEGGRRAGTRRPSAFTCAREAPLPYPISKVQASTQHRVPLRRVCRLDRGLAIDVARNVGLLTLAPHASMMLAPLFQRIAAVRAPDF